MIGSGGRAAQSRRRIPAGLPPELPELNPAWSRLVTVTDADGIERTFHVLDSGTPAGSGTPSEVGTLLCVHGNPTWSYLWRRLLAHPPAGWRVLAPDQLGMGYSERIGRPRALAERVDDLGRLTHALGITGPVVILAHDWGGIISLGWAADHRRQLAGVVLTNTAVHQPVQAPSPVLLRLARLPVVRPLTCWITPVFVRSATALSRPRLRRTIRAAFAAPYRGRARRTAVADFVADIPFATAHPSRLALDEIAAAVPGLDVPALLLWGPRDPVFGEVHLADLMARLPRAGLQRYERAGHLLPEDAPDYADAVRDFLSDLAVSPVPPPARGAGNGESALAALDRFADRDDPALVRVGDTRISWRDLAARTRAVAAGLVVAGLTPGDRVALLVPPSVDLTVALYAVWRAGGVIVVADQGLGLRGLARALRGAHVDYVIAAGPGLMAAGPLRIPGARISTVELPAVASALLRVGRSMPELAVLGSGRELPPEPGAEADAAVLFTSGATGPAKGVRYRHGRLRAQVDLIRTTYGITAVDRIVAAFAPFALYGPALGIASAVPETDVTRPGSLTAPALARAAAAIDATVVFASPAALRNVVATADDLTQADRQALGRIRLVMSAGAPVPAPLLQAVAALVPSASLHTPYGMTEALPLADIDLPGILAAGAGDGVCVGRPLPGVSLGVAPLDGVNFSSEPGLTGEIWVSAPHLKDSYDARWAVDRRSAAHPGWHRTGDVGFLDDQGRLWIQGRLVHVIRTAAGPVTPVGIELRAQAALVRAGLIDAGAGVAAVGVGPVGAAQVVLVVAGRGPLLPELAVTDAVRAAAGVQVAAVLRIRALPVDLRHQSKIDRVAVAQWAAGKLAGG